MGGGIASIGQLRRPTIGRTTREEKMAQHPPVALQMTASATGQRLHVAYCLHNHDRYCAVFPFDGAAGEPGADFPDLTGQVFTSFRHPSTVHILRVWPPLPGDAPVTFPETPAVSRIGPRSHREVAFCLPLPLREAAEYSPHYPDAPYKEHRARTLTLTIGYLRESDGLEVAAINEELGIYELIEVQGSQWLVSASLDLEVPVLVRQDPGFLRV